MLQLSTNADDLVASLLRLSKDKQVCLLDSCGVGHLGSHLLIAGIEPVEIFEISHRDASETLNLLDDVFSNELAAIFTVSYDFGQKLLGLKSRKKEHVIITEPDVYVALFDTLIVHDYDLGETKLIGKADKFDSIISQLAASQTETQVSTSVSTTSAARSNFTKAAYLTAIETVKELIRDGDTYQTNLTHQINVHLPDGLTPERVFERLRSEHPAPFAAFIKRADSTVVSASPERFFKVTTEGGNTTGRECASTRIISTSPIKGTRKRGATVAEDNELRRELLTSAKDLAENVMIVDLLRNDLGRVCEFGSVNVEKLCDLEEHPTLFHLVSTINGELRDDVKFSDLLSAVFPCGSITGAPKISTMKIIDKIETTNRGLSMGAIGYYLPTSWNSGLAKFDLSVAIRTMVIRDNVATFNVGGGITIDSDAEKEYDETLVKAKALLNALSHTGTI